MGRGSRFHAAINSRVWARVRRAVLQRDGYRCRRCRRPGRLEVHHVQPLHEGGAALVLANLLTLCRGCHIQEHNSEKQDPERLAWREYLREQGVLKSQ